MYEPDTQPFLMLHAEHPDQKSLSRELAFLEELLSQRQQVHQDPTVEQRLLQQVALVKALKNLARR
jgi:hypothetical protein